MGPLGLYRVRDKESQPLTCALSILFRARTRAIASLWDWLPVRWYSLSRADIFGSGVRQLQVGMHSLSLSLRLIGLTILTTPHAQNTRS